MYLGFPSHIYFILKGFDKDPSFSNYTSANLRRLTEHSLECAPLVNYSFEAPAPELCFPLAVFYVLGTTAGGKATSGITFAVSILKRATGAAVASLSFEGLARFADGKQKSRHIPPVIAVTIAGPMTTVWLAYCKIVMCSGLHVTLAHVIYLGFRAAWSAIRRIDDPITSQEYH
jgi:hypothetical protein